jgi:hypothetical protein
VPSGVSLQFQPPASRRYHSGLDNHSRSAHERDLVRASSPDNIWQSCVHSRWRPVDAKAQRSNDGLDQMEDRLLPSNNRSGTLLIADNVPYAYTDGRGR